MPLLLALAAAALSGVFAVGSAAAQSSAASTSSSSEDTNPIGWCCPKNPQGNPDYAFECTTEMLLDDCLTGYTDPLYIGGYDPNDPVAKEDRRNLCNKNCGYPPATPNTAAVCGDQNRETNKGEECEFNIDGSEQDPTCGATYGAGFPFCDPANCLCVSAPPLCGNGARDPNEMLPTGCDNSVTNPDYNGDGAVDEQDAKCYRGGGDPNGTCKSNCTCDYTVVECGDGDVGGTEECDYSICTIPTPLVDAGDYYIDAGYSEEDCIEDGGSITMDNGCPDAHHYCDVMDAYLNPTSASCVCTAEDYCGDGTEGYDEYGWPEECDDGNTADGDGCSASCETEGCGDGYIEGIEECDDGNRDDDDGCSYDCEIESCGNGAINPGEQCEPSPVAGTCYVIDDNFDIVADYEYTGLTAFHDCVLGDPANGLYGYPEPTADAYCSSYCTYLSCGDGIVKGTEQCDDGSPCIGGTYGGDYINGTTLTETACTEAGGSVGSPEDGDGCSADCVWEECGNYVVQPNTWLNEVCDDGGLCLRTNSSTGQEEEVRPIDSPADYEMCINPNGNYNGYAWGSVRQNATPPDVCDEYCQLMTCGNAVIDVGEECDNGGTCVDSGGNPIEYEAGKSTVGSEQERQACLAYGGTIETEDSYNPDGESACSASCKYMVCGNGGTPEPFLQEDCDPGAFCDCTGASSDCISTFYDTDGTPILLQSTSDLQACFDADGTWVVNDQDPSCASDCTVHLCGDGVEDTAFGEECDDGAVCNGGLLDDLLVSDTLSANDPNYVSVDDCTYFGGVALPESGDGCDDYCYKEICGNAYYDYGEDCDNGYCNGGTYDRFHINAYSGNNTDTDTLPDGTTITLISYLRCIEGGGIASAGQLYGCSDDCKLGTCGDGTKDYYEDCDDGARCAGGQTYDGYDVPSDISIQQCIDDGGVVTPESGDGCSEYCETEQCGNYVLDSVSPTAMEDCDDGSFCSCVSTTLGSPCYSEGWDDAWLGSNEDIAGCEDVGGVWLPDDSGTCGDDCKLLSCGNGKVDGTAEQCDDGGICILPDGGGLDGTEVTSESAIASCLSYASNAYILPMNGDGCDADCKDEVCGNKKVDAGEDCETNKVYCDVDGDGNPDSPIFSEADYDACWRAAFANNVITYDEFLLVEAENGCDEQCKDGRDKKIVYCCEGGTTGWEFKGLADCGTKIIGGSTLMYTPVSGDNYADWDCELLTDDDLTNDGLADVRCPIAPQDWQCAVYNNFQDCRGCGSCDKSITDTCNQTECDTLGGGAGGMCEFTPGWLYGGTCKPNVNNATCKGQLCDLSDAEVSQIAEADCQEPMMFVQDTSTWGSILTFFGYPSGTCVKGPMCIPGALFECATYDENGQCTACYAPIEDNLYELGLWMQSYTALSPESDVFACPMSDLTTCGDSCNNTLL